MKKTWWIGIGVVVILIIILLIVLGIIFLPDYISLKKDMSFCSKLEEEIQRDECYYGLLYNYEYKFDLPCSKLSENYKGQCYVEYIYLEKPYFVEFEKDTADYLEYVEKKCEDPKVNKDICYLSFSILAPFEKKTCDKITEESLKYYCGYAGGINFENVDFCENIDKEFEKDTCYKMLFFGNVTCENVEDPMIKDYCYYRNATRIYNENNFSMCFNIKDSSLKQDCFFNIIEETSDYEYNKETRKGKYEWNYSWCSLIPNNIL